MMFIVRVKQALEKEMFLYNLEKENQKVKKEKHPRSLDEIRRLERL